MNREDPSHGKTQHLPSPPLVLCAQSSAKGNGNSSKVAVLVILGPEGGIDSVPVTVCEFDSSFAAVC